MRHLIIFLVLLLSYCATPEQKNGIVEQLEERANSFKKETENFHKTKYATPEEKSQSCEELLISGDKIISDLRKEMKTLNSENISLKKENSELADKADKYDWWRNRIYAAIALLIIWEFRVALWKLIQKAVL